MIEITPGKTLLDPQDPKGSESAREAPPSNEPEVVVADVAPAQTAPVAGSFDYEHATD